MGWSIKNITDQSGQMEWSQFSIKILAINFGISILDTSNWEKISKVIIKKDQIQNRVRLSLRGKKLIVNQILVSKLWYIGQIYTIQKYIIKKKKKQTEKIYNFPQKEKKI